MPTAALTMSGLLLQAGGNQAEARKRFERAVAGDERAVVAANNLAWMYADAGEKLPEALRLARSAAELVPDNADMLDTLGWVYLKSSLPALAVAPSDPRDRDRSETCGVSVPPGTGASQVRRYRTRPRRSESSARA